MSGRSLTPETRSPPRVKKSNSPIPSALSGIKRKIEEERLRIINQAMEEAKRAQELEEKKRKVIEERRREEKAQQKLRDIGVCPVGYHWIKQAGGYRCKGGSHFVTDAQLGM